MNFLKFALNGLVLVALIYALNTKIGILPPVGKFIDPFHGLWQNADDVQQSDNQLSKVANLSQQVDILYDSLLIPHIFASNDQDMMFAIGYVSAKHRLWQMEIQSYAAAGRISEIFGASALDYDRKQRRQGMLSAAETTFDAWKSNDTIMHALDAYTNGVNAYINSLALKDYPLEYKLFDYAPEPWTSFKTALILKYMAAMLTLSESDIRNTNLAGAYGKEVYDILYPDYPEGTIPVVREASNTFENSTPNNFQADSLLKLPILSKIIEQPNPDNGSNNWAVSANKTESGNAILANDMHLDLNLPCIWFTAQLNHPEYNIKGYVIPGTPFAITGHNDSISWGFTSANRDFVDWFQIQFKDDSKKEYLLDGEWHSVDYRVEEIKVRNEATFYDTVSYTHFGPVVYDENYLSDHPNVNLAMKWVAHQASYEPLTYLKLSKARNFSEFRKAIQHFSCPPLNMAYADAAGNVAMQVQGSFPNKFIEQGKFVMDGTKRSSEWTQFIPFEDNLYEYNPSRNFVSSANQLPGDDEYPYYVYNAYNEDYRNRRINQVLESDSVVSVKDNQSLQYDNYSLKAAEILPILLDTLVISPNETEQKIIAQLTNWDYMYLADANEPVYFELWWKNVYLALWESLFGTENGMRYPGSYYTYLLIKNQRLEELYNKIPGSTKISFAGLVNQSFKTTALQIEQDEDGKYMDWGSYNKVSLNHFTRIAPFGFQNLQANGSGDAALANKGSHGPSQHMIIEMSDDIKMWSNYPGGQSGNPGSKYYDTFVDAWVKGKYFEVPNLKKSDKESTSVLFHHSLTKQ